jgi:hypothetical protein
MKRSVPAFVALALILGAPGLLSFQARAEGNKSSKVPARVSITVAPVSLDVQRLAPAAPQAAPGVVTGAQERPVAGAAAGATTPVVDETSAQAVATPSVSVSAESLNQVALGAQGGTQAGEAAGAERVAERFGEALGERRRTAADAAQTSLIPGSEGARPQALEARRAGDGRYLRGSVDEPGFIARENADPRFTVVFDLNDTLEWHDDRADPDRVVVRPGIEQEFARLRAAGAKIVLWTKAERWWVEKHFKAYEKHFDAIITFENDRGEGKSLSKLGYGFIVDDRPELKTQAQREGFAHALIPKFVPGEAAGQRNFASAVDEALALANIHALKATPDGDPVQILDLVKDKARVEGELGASPLVFAINRSIFSVSADGSEASIKRAAGGAAPAIYGALKQQGGGIVFAAAMSDAERALAKHGKVLRVGEGMYVRYIDLSREVFDKHYAGFSNSVLWPVQHGLVHDFDPLTGVDLLSAANCRLALR